MRLCGRSVASLPQNFEPFERFDAAHSRSAAAVCGRAVVVAAAAAVAAAAGSTAAGAAALPSPPKATDDARRASVAFVHALRIRSGAENDQVSRWAYSDACSAKRPSESAQIATTCTVRRDDVRRAPRTGEAGCTFIMGRPAQLHRRRSCAAGVTRGRAALRSSLRPRAAK